MLQQHWHSVGKPRARGRGGVKGGGPALCCTLSSIAAKEREGSESGGDAQRGSAGQPCSVGCRAAIRAAAWSFSAQ